MSASHSGLLTPRRRQSSSPWSDPEHKHHHWRPLPVKIVITVTGHLDRDERATDGGMTEGDHVPRVITFAGLGRLYLSNSPGRETAAVTLLQQFNCTFAAAACHRGYVLQLHRRRLVATLRLLCPSAEHVRRNVGQRYRR